MVTLLVTLVLQGDISTNRMAQKVDSILSGSSTALIVSFYTVPRPALTGGRVNDSVLFAAVLLQTKTRELCSSFSNAKQS